MRNKLAIIAICALLAAITFPAAARVIKTSNISGRSDEKAQTAQTAQTATIKLTKEGYQPESFKLKRDVPARVTISMIVTAS